MSSSFSAFPGVITVTSAITSYCSKSPQLSWLIGGLLGGLTEYKLDNKYKPRALQILVLIILVRIAIMVKNDKVVIPTLIYKLSKLIKKTPKSEE